MPRRHGGRSPTSAWNRWSASKLQAAECPLKMFLEFVIREPAPQIPIAAFGQAAHYTFYRFFKSHPRTGRYPYATEDKLIGAWKGFWWRAVGGHHGFGSLRDKPAEVVWKSTDEPGQLFGLGIKVMRIFHQQHQTLRQDGFRHLPERRFVFNWQGLTISGVVDRLDVTPQGAVITDYKNGRYPDYQLVSGVQLTIYQLAYEFFFRSQLPGQPPLIGLQIYDYRSGDIQQAPLRSAEEIALLHYYLQEAAAYVCKVLRGPAIFEWPQRVRLYDPADVEQGDFSPKLPRGEHCKYCSYFRQCRLWELGQLPRSRDAFQKKHRQALESLQPAQIRLPIVALPQITRGAKQYLDLVEKPRPEQLHLILDI